jgi:hypothetical protein
MFILGIWKFGVDVPVEAESDTVTLQIAFIYAYQRTEEIN